MKNPRSQPTLMSLAPPNSDGRPEATFYYFAYGSCMCPVDLQRSLGEPTHPYVVGPASLQGHRLGFLRRSPHRNCGVLDVVADPHAQVLGVLYRLPWRLSAALDLREEVPQGGYRHQIVQVHRDDRVYANVRTYVVVNKLTEELPPNDWYFDVVLRGALTCGLPEQYCWQLFNHMHRLQQCSRTTLKLRQEKDPLITCAASVPEAG